MNSNNTCENKNVFDFIDREEIERTEYYQKSKDVIGELKETITKLSVQNQKLLEKVDELENHIKSKIQTTDRIKRTTLDLCDEIVNYVDIDKLREDLETMNFTSSVRDLLEYISHLRPFKTE